MAKFISPARAVSVAFLFTTWHSRVLLAKPAASKHFFVSYYPPTLPVALLRVLCLCYGFSCIHCIFCLFFTTVDYLFVWDYFYLITCQSIINSNVFPAISGYLHTIELSATEGYISFRHNRLRILYL
jgi:hypothetical protein